MDGLSAEAMLKQCFVKNENEAEGGGGAGKREKRQESLFLEKEKNTIEDDNNIVIGSWEERGKSRQPHHLIDLNYPLSIHAVDTQVLVP